MTMSGGGAGLVRRLVQIALRTNLPLDVEFVLGSSTVNHVSIHVVPSSLLTEEQLPAGPQIAGFELATSAPASMLAE